MISQFFYYALRIVFKTTGTAIFNSLAWKARNLRFVREVSWSRKRTSCIIRIAVIFKRISFKNWIRRSFFGKKHNKSNLYCGNLSKRWQNVLKYGLRYYKLNPGRFFFIFLGLNTSLNTRIDMTSERRYFFLKINIQTILKYNRFS